MRFSSTLLLSLIAAAPLNGAPTQEDTIKRTESVAKSRDTVAKMPELIGHDLIDPWPETVPKGLLGETLKKFEPYIHISHGCQPYSAVDSNGRVSAGLSPTGDPSGGCRDERKGQTYARGAWQDGTYIIVYAWYFPKDQPMAGNMGGHRHDWAFAAVQINNPEVANPVMHGAVTLANGLGRESYNPFRENNRIKVEYFTWEWTDHAMKFTKTLGRDLPIMWWDSLPDVSKEALNNMDFGTSFCPINKDYFQKVLEFTVNNLGGTRKRK